MSRTLALPFPSTKRLQHHGLIDMRHPHIPCEEVSQSGIRIGAFYHSPKPGLVSSQEPYMIDKLAADFARAVEAADAGRP